MQNITKFDPCKDNLKQDIFKKINVGNSLDAELQAIQGIPQLLRYLPQNRKISILKYILERYESGDDFGIE